MIFLGKLWGRKKDTQKFLGKVKKISKLTDSINKQSKKLESEEYNLILESKEDIYISLESFLNIIDRANNLTMTDIMEKCVHITDLKDSDVAYIDVYAISDNDGHVVLCANPSKCDVHKDYDGDPIRIISLRRNK